MALDVYYDEFQPSWEEEGLFARDVNGQLVRVVEASEQDYFQEVTVTIDGEPIRVSRAVPTTDAQGNIIYLDAAGRTKPRRTTIYDAALALCLKQLSRTQPPTEPFAESTTQDQQLLESAKSKLMRMIPTVCHLDHVPPAGVCRVCSVELARQETDPHNANKKIYRGSGKLVPACVQPVEDGMFVNTLAGADGGRVRRAVKVLLELLVADHLPARYDPALREKEQGPSSEFAQLLEDLDCAMAPLDAESAARDAWLQPKRFAPRQPWSIPPDDTSPLILVDPNACILCDRCSRACTDVKQNFVIGRTGKGYTTRVGFDLGDAMGNSSCVECGECMLSCPTTALTFREPVEKSDWFLEQVGGENPVTRRRYPGMKGKTPVTPIEMDANELLRNLPWRYREWNQYSVVRWRLKAGDILCHVGEYGATAFLLQSGSFEVLRQDDSPLVLDRQATILGEMVCLNHYPRAATVKAKTDSEVFEVRRNMLFALQRVPESRARLSSVYRQRAIDSFIRGSTWFDQISKDERKQARQYMLDAWNQPRATPDGAVQRAKVELVQLSPGQVIFREGEQADAFYMIRIGHIRVSSRDGGIICYVRARDEFASRPGGPRASGVQPSYFGEIGCLADWPAAAEYFPPDQRDPRRRATCAALDHVELIRIDRDCFRGLLDAIPALKKGVLDGVARILGTATTTVGGPMGPEGAATKPAQLQEGSSTAPLAPLRREFVEQGLYNAQRLLVLDLEACTRCDECTKACSDTHDGITRLIREGLRIDKWLVASSCRSCSDPYCLVGCPVDAIHRDGKGKQIQIESHCIGCGLCANNCPYGNINMHPRQKGDELQHTATTCDLCSNIVGPENWRQVSCVFACPHDAAFRMTGDEFWNELEAARK